MFFAVMEKISESALSNLRKLPFDGMTIYDAESEIEVLLAKGMATSHAV